MEQILSMLKQSLGGEAVREMSRKVGAEEAATGNAMEMGLQMLLTGLARNSARPEGARSLAAALERDHDGSILDDLPRRLADPSKLQAEGGGILRHVFGERRGAVESRLGQASGVGANGMGTILATLAPVVLGSLGRVQKQKGLDAGALASMLGQETKSAARRSREGAGILGKILDADQDGDVMDDLGRLGGSLLGKLFGSR